MILVIADDFSGAAEVAGAAHRLGLCAEVQIDGLRRSDCDVVVIDANTRSLSPRLAASKVAKLAESVREAQPRWIYKKIDSVLRGPILAELQALSGALGSLRCLLINSNPRKGRLVRSGQLLVDGRPIHRTVFANDPEHPRTSSSVLSLLGAEPDQVQLIDHLGQAFESRSPGKVILANIESIADLDQYADCKQQYDSYLLAGAAEFFESLLLAEVGDSGLGDDEELTLAPGTLIVRGTSVRPDQEASWMRAVQEVACGSQSIETSVTQISKRLVEETCVAISADRERDANPYENLPSGLSLQVAEQRHQKLIEVVNQLMLQFPPSHLWIEGGRTASSIIRRCGWGPLRVRHHYADGVVGLRACSGESTELVVKPGSYPWPISSNMPATMAEVKP